MLLYKDVSNAQVCIVSGQSSLSVSQILNVFRRPGRATSMFGAGCTMQTVNAYNYYGQGPFAEE